MGCAKAVVCVPKGSGTDVSGSLQMFRAKAFGVRARLLGTLRIPVQIVEKHTNRVGMSLIS